RSCVGEVGATSLIVLNHIDVSLLSKLSFIDFIIKKSYLSIDREALWKVLKWYGFSSKLIQILQSLYSIAWHAVRVNGELTEWFEVKNGVEQGCILSPILFALYLENILSNSLSNIGGGCMISGQIINHLDFADDIVMIMPMEECNQEAANNLYTTARKWGLKMNEQKTKLMVTSKIKKQAKLVINGGNTEQVDSFCYLGPII
uniref:ribonuclease H n=1 Tax=Latimeria chalumnae TaxID=7897 RepID=H3APN8_LATCH